MMRSLYAGVAGLKNHQTRMDVIGNNISNVNTYGFKTSRVTFQDMLSQTIAGAARPEENIGGINPKQVGLGMTIASIDRIFTQGSLQTTGNQTDLAISGDGFFMVAEGDNMYYTRAGNFGLDSDGTLINQSNGFRVQGWMATRDQNGEMVVTPSGNTEDIIIPLYGKLDARATQNVEYRCNLDSRTPIVPPEGTQQMIASAGVTTTIDIYDPQGNTHRVTLLFYHTGPNQWSAQASIQGVDGPVTLDVLPSGEQDNQQNNTNTMNLRFSPDGRIISVGDGGTSDEVNQGDLQVNLNFRLPGSDNPELQTVTLNLGQSGVLAGITQFASPSTTRAVEQDGYGMGYMESFTIDNSGVITGVYSNGVRQTIGQVAMAVFTNPQGLTAQGDNLFLPSNNSGNPNIGPANQGGRGSIIAGTLEMSNVDLADQFTDMIVTQRGFQANSRTITTSDQMLQELINLKR